LKDLPLAVRWRRYSRQGRASSPTVGERALPASQQIGNLGTWEVFRGALNKKTFSVGTCRFHIFLVTLQGYSSMGEPHSALMVLAHVTIKVLKVGIGFNTWPCRLHCIRAYCG